MDNKELTNKQIWVLAGNYYEFLNFCRENYYNPKDKNIRYLSSFLACQGGKGFKLVLYGTYQERKWVNPELIAELQWRSRN